MKRTSSRTSTRTSTRTAAALCGVLAAGATLGAAHLAAALVAPGADPFTAAGDAFVDVTPAWLKDLAVRLFGTADKTVLLIGAGVVLALVAATAGVLGRRNRGAALALVVATGALGAVAAATRPDAPPLAVVPALVGTLVGALSLVALLDRLPAPGPPAPSPPHGPPTGPGRRPVLVAAALVGAVAVVGAAAGTAVDRTRRATAALRDGVRLPRPARAAAPVPAGAQVPLDGTVPVVTPNGDFYRIDTALAVPRVDPTTWRLRVHGLVEQEVELTFAELLAADLVEAWATLVCVSNPVGGDLAGTARWLGLPVREVLRSARPSPGADMVLSRSVDGFTASTPLEVLTDDRDALLAVGMNGEPLPLAHGFPVRMVVPGLYGYVSATKWLVDLEVTRFADRTAYWTDRGWAARGPVRLASRVEVPRQGARLDAGDVVVAGTAWAPHTGIAAVEVSVDDGPWEQATLADAISPDTWRQWSWRWRAEPGEHRVRCRAVDADGEVQTAEVRPPAPSGSSGLHSVRVTVR